MKVQFVAPFMVMDAAAAFHLTLNELNYQCATLRGESTLRQQQFQKRTVLFESSIQQLRSVSKQAAAVSAENTTDFDSICLRSNTYADTCTAVNRDDASNFIKKGTFLGESSGASVFKTNVFFKTGAEKQPLFMRRPLRFALTTSNTTNNDAIVVERTMSQKIQQMSKVIAEFMKRLPFDNNKWSSLNANDIENTKPTVVSISEYCQDGLSSTALELTVHDESTDASNVPEDLFTPPANTTESTNTKPEMTKPQNSVVTSALKTKPWGTKQTKNEDPIAALQRATKNEEFHRNMLTTRFSLDSLARSRQFATPAVHEEVKANSHAANEQELLRRKMLATRFAAKINRITSTETTNIVNDNKQTTPNLQESTGLAVASSGFDESHNFEKVDTKEVEASRRAMMATRFAIKAVAKKRERTQFTEQLTIKKPNGEASVDFASESGQTFMAKKAVDDSKKAVASLAPAAARAPASTPMTDGKEAVLEENPALKISAAVYAQLLGSATTRYGGYREEITLIGTGIGVQAKRFTAKSVFPAKPIKSVRILSYDQLFPSTLGAEMKHIPAPNVNDLNARELEAKPVNKTVFNSDENAVNITAGKANAPSNKHTTFVTPATTNRTILASLVVLESMERSPNIYTPTHDSGLNASLNTVVTQAPAKPISRKNETNSKIDELESSRLKEKPITPQTDTISAVSLSRKSRALNASKQTPDHSPADGISAISLSRKSRASHSASKTADSVHVPIDNFSAMTLSKKLEKRTTEYTQYVVKGDQVGPMKPSISQAYDMIQLAVIADRRGENQAALDIYREALAVFTESPLKDAGNSQSAISLDWAEIEIYMNRAEVLNNLLKTQREKPDENHHWTLGEVNNKNFGANPDSRAPRYSNDKSFSGSSSATQVTANAPREPLLPLTTTTKTKAGDESMSMISQGSKLIKMAVAADNERNYETALCLYRDAFARFRIGLSSETVEASERLDFEEIERYIDRAEELRFYLERVGIYFKNKAAAEKERHKSSNESGNYLNRLAPSVKWWETAGMPHRSTESNSERFLTKGRHLLQNAIDAEKAKDYVAAFDLYREALAHLSMGLKFEKDVEVTQAILDDIEDYLGRVEELGTFLSNASANSTPDCDTEQPAVKG